MFTDETRLRQILTNLVSNAIKFTSSGYVRIRTQVLQQSETHIILVIRVEDSGIGIPANQLDNLFQMFYQVKTNATKQIQGTGIGLFLCKQLAEALMGTISVDSRAGAGSTFAVQFPLAYRYTGQYCLRLPPWGEEETKMQILLIDPCSFSQEFLTTSLDALTQDRVVATVWNETTATKHFTASTDELFNLFAMYTVVFIDNSFRSQYPDVFNSLQLNPTIRQKCVLLRKIRSTDDLHEKGTRNEFIELIRPVVIEELANTLCTILQLSPAPSPAAIRDRFLGSDTRIAPVLSKGSYVLVVDDQTTNLMILKKLLQSFGCVVHCANCGEDALAEQLTFVPGFDLVLMDMCMAPMDGLTCAKKWRENEAFSKTPFRTVIVASTGNSSQEDIQNCKAAGMDYHLAKPITKAKLSQFVRKPTPSVDQRKTPGDRVK